ncbi:hypothetical protein HPQ64_08125 [Rhizobiales bacterium]|uniref:protoglobin domain-containing protein n=1 Tax=Hongsoonwoonella zoysiae TaxID=2821844 RepID=UPI00155FF830|nr:protoglobin domain-containing protein [Hongsoonwoonella zoysiae]NRG17652.1 hypothetical protein [Hongsoonwoonella zoysiae]
MIFYEKFGNAPGKALDVLEASEILNGFPIPDAWKFCGRLIKEAFTPDIGRAMGYSSVMDAQSWNEISDYIEFLEFSAEDKKNASDAWAIMQPRMLSILDEFYSTRRINLATRNFPGIDIQKLSQKQYEYWEKLFAGSLDEIYAAHARGIGAKHRAYGVTMTDYIMAYGWFMNAFERTLVKCGCEDAAVKRMMSSVRRLVFFDLSIAASTYHVVYVD